MSATPTTDPTPEICATAPDRVTDLSEEYSDVVAARGKDGQYEKAIAFERDVLAFSNDFAECSGFGSADLLHDGAVYLTEAISDGSDGENIESGEDYNAYDRVAYRGNLLMEDAGLVGEFGDM